MSRLPDFYDETKNYVIRRSTFRKNKLARFSFSQLGILLTSLTVAILVGYLCQDVGVDGDGETRRDLYTMFLFLTYLCMPRIVYIKTNTDYKQFCTNVVQIERYLSNKDSLVSWERISYPSELFSILFGVMSVSIILPDHGLGSMAQVFIPVMFAVSYGVWLFSNLYWMELHSISTWTSTYRVSRAIMEKYSEVSESESFGFETNVTLESREILQELNQHQESLDCQLIRLGIRPEVKQGIAIISWDEVSENKSIYDSEDFIGKDGKEPFYSINSKIKSHNDNIQSQILLLIEHQMLRSSLGRLRLTVHGMEKLALPANLFISKIPNHYQQLLGRGDNLFHSQAYEGAVNVFGKLWESFFKHELQDYATIEEQRDLFGKKWKGLPSLGDLLAYFSTFLDLNPHINELTDEQIQKIKLHMINKGHSKEHSILFGAFYNMASICKDLRNELTHDRENINFTFEHTEANVFRTYRLLQLSRIAIMEYYAVKRN